MDRQNQLTHRQPAASQLDIDHVDAFWRSKRVIVTGGSGFLGSYVVSKLWKRGAAEVITPRRREYDLRHLDAIRQLLRDTSAAGRPVDMVIHLAANVGGIGANR
ncbi:MAG: NAD-dependent epimerase/dehydratase family protein, partial [Caldilineaceae bacterium]|nr:NAD-dependent epimerase/dehydratase family protein [Caldilineaceae bacterium]